jgi:hypothetical protein
VEGHQELYKDVYNGYDSTSYTTHNDDDLDSIPSSKKDISFASVTVTKKGKA